MFFGLSKNIGGGFRVGVGRRLGGNSRSRPTQRELQKEEKQEFLDDTQNRFKESITQWFICQGHVVLLDDIDRADSDIANRIKPIAKKFSDSQRLVRDGGTLTAKRRETMLEAIYEIEDLLGEIKEVHPLAENYEMYSRVYSFGIWSLMFAFLSIVPALFFTWLFLLTGVLAFAGAYALKEASDKKSLVLKVADVVISDI